MEVVQGYHNLNRSLTHPVVTIGNFDGVHLGHKKIIETAVSQAKEKHGISIAYTFRPHPQIALRPEGKLQLLSTYDEKLDLLGKLGIDMIVEEPFSREFSTTSPDRFFNDVLLRKIGVEAVVVGYDFAFGKERQGHLENLEAFCKGAGVGLTVVPAYRIENDVVSSSRIRQYLVSGDVPAANRLLGHEFFYRGLVMKGDGRGKKIGTPTANLGFGEKLILPFGVYATRAVVNGVAYASVTNIGIRPTFTDPKNQPPAFVETHLLDMSLDLYGNQLEVHFAKKLRDEKKFSSVDELKIQISKDIETARAVLK